MDDQTKIPFSGKVKKSDLERMKVYGKITLGVVCIAVMVMCIIAVAKGYKAPEKGSEDLQKLHDEKMQVELSLKNALTTSKDAQTALDEANKQAGDLRAKRAALETSINTTINPDSAK